MPKRPAAHPDERDPEEVVEFDVAGQHGRLRGVGATDIMLAVIVVLCTAFVWWSDEQRARAFIDQHHITQQILSQVIQNQTIIIETTAEQTYVLTLPPGKREELNLAMPQSLRKKVQGR